VILLAKATVKMPYTLLPRVAPHTISADQPPTSQISGFYGPGTWAAWVLALTSSLFALRKQPDNHAALNLIPSILYINWAANDLLKQPHTEESSLELVASASGISLWGVWYLSLVQMVLGAHDDCPSCGSKMRTMRLMALLGFLVPFIALIATIFHADGANLNGMLSDGSIINYCLFILNMIGCLSYQIVVARRLAFPQRKRTPSKWSVEDRILGWYFVLSINRGSLLYTMNVFQYAASLRDVEDYQWTCALKPCGPQSITESDQGFALCCGLLMFAYEVGSDILAYIRRWVHVAALKDIQLVTLAYIRSYWVLLRTSTFAGRVKRHWPGQGSN
jgi:hypothetical protein